MKKVIFLYGALVVILIILALARAGKINIGNINQSLPGERTETTTTTSSAENATIPQATINGVTYNLLIANTDETRMQGLSGREGLDDNQGMLFIFDQKGTYSFWMKDMKFPIDIIYIDGNRIVEIKENATPPKQGQDPATTIYNPKAAAQYVLEVNAGEVEDENIKVGDTVGFSNLPQQ